MKVTKPEDLKMGKWHTRCCQRELEEIRTQEDIDQIIDDWDDTGIRSHEVWETKLEALQEIVTRYKTPEFDEERMDCEERIKECLKA